MGASDSDGETPPPVDQGASADVASEAAVEELREELQGVREELESRTRHREAMEADLRSYVRGEVRSGHARGWGPYLVLLYGTVMTVAAFYYETGVWAIVAMVVIWLSTLGLYVLMILIEGGLVLAELPMRTLTRIRNR